MRNTYTTSQFQRIEPVNEYGARIQLASDTGKTNWINVDKQCLAEIKEAMLRQECRESNNRGGLSA